MVVIVNCPFRISAVIAPPKLSAPLKVTSWPFFAPWSISLTVIMVEPSDAVKVTSPADEDTSVS